MTIAPQFDFLHLVEDFPKRFESDFSVEAFVLQKIYQKGRLKNKLYVRENGVVYKLVVTKKEKHWKEI